MLRYIFSLLICVVLFSEYPVLSQITSQGKPFYKPQEDTISIPVINIKVPVSKKEQKAEDFHFKDDHFAVPVDIYLDPDDYGKWIEYKEFNTSVLLLAIQADNAISMNIILEDFELLPGVKLFFYNESQTQILGDITSRNNKPTKVLPISPLYGKKIFMELQVPTLWEDYGTFNISRIGVETKALYTTYKNPLDRWFDGSQPCNFNVNCFTESNVQIQKNAVVRILFNATGRCTGTLINNLEYNETPYVITAAHCFNTEYVANRAVFNFNYESPNCENIDGPNHSVSGATLVAVGYHGSVYDSLDFLLLKLSENIPIEYEPYYSGWDASGIVPDSTYSIHHPLGDIKKISYDTDSPKTISSGSGFMDGTHWLVEDYDIGTSEDGSSGSGLVDSKNRLIGTLTGGGFACSLIINDVYQKFSHSYSDFDDPYTQLKVWLDPENTGQLVCNGSDPSGAILKGMADLLTNFDESDVLETIPQTLGWGYLAGHNYQENKLFAEHFTFNGSKYLYQFDFYPVTVYSSNPDHTLKFVIWKGGNKPGEKIYEKQYALAEFFSVEPPINIILDSTLLISEDFYAGFQIEYNSDTFALKNIQTDNALNSSYTFIDGSWKQLQLNGESKPSHMALRAYAFDYMPKKGVFIDTSEFAQVSIYPNPVNDQLQILFKDIPEGDITCKLVDLSGRIVLTKTFSEPAANIPLHIDSQQGMYVLHVFIGNKSSVTFKVLVL